MGSDGIHVAAGQHRILHAAVFDAEHIDRLRDARIRAAEEDLLRLAGALHGDGLSGKVAECPDAAVGIHWTDARYYDLCLDSSKLGFENCALEIEEYAKIRFGK